jgi:hypothetical protein
MASIRNLKKDIDFLTSMVIIDCFQYINYSENADQESAFALVRKVIASGNDLRDRASHPDGSENPALVKKYYRKIGEDLVKVCDQAYEELSKIIKDNPGKSEGERQ